MKLFFALLLTSLSLSNAAHAIEPERREAIVVNGRVWEGFAYKENLLPSTLSEFHLMSGKESAIEYVRTQEYYWPLSRQVYVDFEKQRDVLEGVLRIEQDGKRIADIARSDYAIIYPQGAINGNGTLVWGPEALATYTTYLAEEKAFNIRFAAAQREQSAYERKLIDAGAARKKGGVVEVIPPPNPLPEPSLRLVTRPVSGYRILLEPGLYQMALYDGETRVPGTQRALRIVDVTGRRSTVADIIPEERWTRPLAANSMNARVFVQPGSTFYVTLAEADRFDEAEYLPVVTPQAEPVKGRSTWVRRKPSDKAEMKAGWETLRSETMSLARLKVEQTEGSGFGYRVRNAKETEKEDLSAFMIKVPEDGGISRGLLTVQGDAGFQREVVIVQPRQDQVALGLAFMPFAGWLAWAFWRRRTPEQA